MESLQNLKRRLTGVKNIGQITKAMELVAATKMRRSQEIALASRPYAFSALDLLASLSQSLSSSTPLTASNAEGLQYVPPLLQKREIKKTAVVVITSDKGLAGSFNSAVLRKFDAWLENSKQSAISHKPISYVAVGQKAAAHLERRVLPVEQKFVRISDYTTIAEVQSIADFLTNGFLNGAWDRVVVFSTHFRTALKQEVLVREILPVSIEALKTAIAETVPESGKFSEFRTEKELAILGESKAQQEYLIEPSPQEVLGRLAEHLVLMEIYHLVLEANASEHAARRMAMKNASDNAQELSERLTLVYNKSRQAAITKEIIEISAGAESLRT